MSWVPASWVNVRAERDQSAMKLRRERERFAKLRPPTPEEAAELINRFLAEREVTKGPSVEQRREMWGMG